MNLKKLLFRSFAYIFLILVFIASVFPFYWMIVGMTNSAVDVIKGKMTFGNQLIYNFKTLTASYNLGKILFNSIKISLSTMIGTLIATSMAAYGFEIYRARTREKIYNIILLSMMIPLAALMVPLFRLIVELKLLNTPWGVILPAIASVFILFFFRQSFKSFPKEIIEAARIDGAGELRIFSSIVVPMMKSTYAAAAILSFTTSWNSYLWPLIVLQTDEQKTITLLISSLASAYFPEYGIIMMTIVIATLPNIIVFFTLQRYFVQGMTGAIKQ
ncbi:carbohydrate ABC transporter permease [Caldanaerobacter subterraneus]|uniref:Lactose/L-arabinose transport system permease protein n=1 Tax=Caldanaerobacter subterraneus TaxID=911092 RepID=A0A4R2KNG5_9THEO|nr:carbohydrate ABC transporter permease [Caldanaerobacter subterraneus]TCO68115.1 lactose/L-arabinose transport system permease protein [Caldanaerobacter subterraneus]